jgi:hypothetical protein
VTAPSRSPLDRLTVRLSLTALSTAEWAALSEVEGRL